MKGSKFRKGVWLAAVTAFVYTVCKSRNEALWSQKVMTVISADQKIQMDIKGRLVHLKPRKISVIQWVSNL